jgi:putative ABC transport system ATP-binding protein
VFVRTMSATRIVELEHIEKVVEGPLNTAVLRGIDLCLTYGEIVAITGPSGSGKSTLLNILGCLDRPTRGQYRLGGRDVSALNRYERAWVRLHYVGFVFQAFHLLRSSTALENVALPLFYAGLSRRERDARATALLERVGLGDRLEHRPSELSGGQRQRVAIARALACRPKLLLADEPTGALDSRSGKDVMRLLGDLHQEGGITIVVVTHDPLVAGYAPRQISLLDGRIVADDENQGTRAAAQ